MNTQFLLVCKFLILSKSPPLTWKYGFQVCFTDCMVNSDLFFAST